MLKIISTFFKNIVDKNANMEYSIKCRQKRQQKLRKGGTGMVDTPLLEQKIKNSGKKYGYLAEKLGISRQYFRMKCKNKADFTNRETDILCSELGITSLTEKEKIFFKK